VYADDDEIEQLEQFADEEEMEALAGNGEINDFETF